MKYSDVLEEFESISRRYKNLVDSDVGEAYSLMINSSSLLSSYEQMYADAVKLVSMKERLAKATEARVSCELSPKPTEGARRAAFHEDVLNGWKDYAESLRNQKYIEANSKFLSRVYFDTKMIVENCYRKERPAVGDNRVVGRT